MLYQAKFLTYTGLPAPNSCCWVAPAVLVSEPPRYQISSANGHRLPYIAHNKRAHSYTALSPSPPQLPQLPQLLQLLPSFKLPNPKMSVTFRLPPPKTDAACPASSSKMPCSPRKRFMPPSSDFNTSITSSGYQPVDRDNEDKGTCQDPRVRYPKAEAILQMFFRFCTIALNVTVLVFLHYVCKHPDYAVVAKKFYAAVRLFVCYLILSVWANMCRLGRVLPSPQHRRNRLAR